MSMQQPETPVGPVPEVYSDTFQVTVTPFGVNMTFGLREPHPPQNRPQQSTEKVLLRMSLEHAKIMAMVLRRQILGHERRMGAPIKLPGEVYTQLGVPEEDWPPFSP